MSARMRTDSNSTIDLTGSGSGDEVSSLELAVMKFAACSVDHLAYFQMHLSKKEMTMAGHFPAQRSTAPPAKKIKTTSCQPSTSTQKGVAKKGASKKRAKKASNISSMTLPGMWAHNR